MWTPWLGLVGQGWPGGGAHKGRGDGGVEDELHEESAVMHYREGEKEKGDKKGVRGKKHGHFSVEFHSMYKKRVTGHLWLGNHSQTHNLDAI